MKTAIITGGSGSIGSCLAAEFAKDYRVLFTYCRNEKAAYDLSQKYGCEAVKCDLTQDSHISKLLSMVNCCDLLINNAGISHVGLFNQLSYSQIQDIIGVNLIGTMKLTKDILNLMIREKSGCIINISSIWGVYGGSCEAAYSASKAGIIGFTKALSKEVGISGIRVNCIAPGLIDSKMNSHLSQEEIKSFCEESTSLGKIGKPEDIAKAARYLSQAEFVTGEVLSVDGGFCG